ncbi:MAG TPA: methionyl-tRNA formyltransferase [Candidatus Woesebacteria bacterium]|nr:methionyl-tRNA formyltransferase [Candidatus Woesebacteria bacterium]HPR99446.1 methionyl-tRNA formyltransferase [Candidatus Woesebacteria bacterium]
MTKIIFFGASIYSLPILEKLLELPDFELQIVVSKINKAFGRSQKITPNPVAKYCLDHHLPLLQIETFSEDCKLKIKDFKADLGLCVAFGPPFFDEDIINSFSYKIINIHPSPLPKYRGATPGPWQIINGETKSAVTFFQIDPLPDHGPIITTLPFDISPTETAQSFYQKAFSLAADNLQLVLESYLSNPESLLPQDHSQKSYFPKLTKDTAKIDWSWNLNKIEAFIRALNPWPIAWTFVENLNHDIFKMKIFSAFINQNKSDLIPETVQIEGKNKTEWNEIKKYYSLIRKN